jgi:hypothetical protein
MSKLLGELPTAYALYTLGGAGLLFIFFAGSCWYVQGNFGWIALGVYLVAWWIIAECLIAATVKWIKKNSIFYSQEAWEKHRTKSIADDRNVRKERVRSERHGY